MQFRAFSLWLSYRMEMTILTFHIQKVKLKDTSGA